MPTLYLVAPVPSTSVVSTPVAMTVDVTTMSVEAKITIGLNEKTNELPLPVVVTLVVWLVTVILLSL